MPELIHSMAFLLTSSFFAARSEAYVWLTCLSPLSLMIVK
ncbi:hypothetical protein HMPREF9412_3984 [Paenibacillus sp. HGF5]|nr:hypothetical protein HMPREF9412_3984 [Paenibacillus sp. HGF5]